MALSFRFEQCLLYKHENTYVQRDAARSISPEAPIQYPYPLLSVVVVFLLGDTLAERGGNISNCKGTGKLFLKNLESKRLLAHYVKCA